MQNRNAKRQKAKMQNSKIMKIKSHRISAIAYNTSQYPILTSQYFITSLMTFKVLKWLFAVEAAVHGFAGGCAKAAYHFCMVRRTTRTSNAIFFK